MAISFRESPAKRLVRETWDTPLLRHLHEQYGFRYRYMGFPGTELVDVRLWRDMLDEVIAFELPAPTGDQRAYITALRRNLQTLGIRNVTYFGSLEEVVILRKDLDGIDYRQENLITLYNLDFCDEIASRVDTRDGPKAWRFEALRTIVQDQHECFRRSDGPPFFIMLLTVRNQIHAGQAHSFLRPRNLVAEAHRYRGVCERTKRIPSRGILLGQHGWALKTFLYNTLRSYFGAPNVSALFFPLVKYMGTPVSRQIPSPMLHWIILCRFGNREHAAPAFYPDDYLFNVISLEAAAGGLRLSAEPGERPNHDQPLGCVEWLVANRPAIFDFGASRA